MTGVGVRVLGILAYVAGDAEDQDVAVSVVIPARNASATLPVQLGALADQDFEGRWELIVADNGSTDGTAVLIEAWREHLPRMRRIVVPDPGANRARNAGVRASAGDRILICDADDEVSSKWIRCLAEALTWDDVAGGPLEYERLSAYDVPRPPGHATAELPSLFGRPYVISASIGFRRKVFEATGGFDETFGVGGDDIDFCWRAQQAGFSLGYAPNALVHYRLRSPMRAYFWQQYGYAKGDAHLYAKHRRVSALPRRTFRRQVIALAGDGLELIRKLPRLGDPPTRWLATQELARLAGRLAGAVRWGVYPP